MNTTLLLNLLPTLMIAAAVLDATTYRIPNWLTGLTALAFVPMAIYAGMPLALFGWHVLMGLILFFVGYAMFALGLFGGGDAKLMAAAGLWFGFGQTYEFILFTVLAGGVLAIAIALLAVVQMQMELSGRKYSDVIKNLAPKVPYGIALAAGAILAFPGSWWMNHVA
jgi:prepilin peptidase CpaA